jgi:hypothetical protein
VYRCFVFPLQPGPRVIHFKICSRTSLGYWTYCTLLSLLWPMFNGVLWEIATPTAVNVENCHNLWCHNTYYLDEEIMFKTCIINVKLHVKDNHPNVREIHYRTSPKCAISFRFSYCKLVTSGAFVYCPDLPWDCHRTVTGRSQITLDSQDCQSLSEPVLEKITILHIYSVAYRFHDPHFQVTVEGQRSKYGNFLLVRTISFAPLNIIWWYFIHTCTITRRSVAYRSDR